jgi:hypothetical protein
MVWHSYLLNPRCYLEDCMRLSRHVLWRTFFPWKQVYDAIDDKTFGYSPNQGAKDGFATSSAIEWDWWSDDENKVIRCPKCCHDITVPYTRHATTSNSEKIEMYLSHDTGYAGQAFQETCQHCSLAVTHKKLRVGKFIADAEALILHQGPLPGTILDLQGIPELTGDYGINTHGPFFPNRVVTYLDDFAPAQLRLEIERLSIEALKTRFQTVMATPGKCKLANLSQYKPGILHKRSKIAVRRVLSHYWDNSSPFGIDLVGAVLRQSSFVLKMVKIDWLHSPAVIPTMQRLIVKYHRFIRMIADHPQKIMVPTLDVDLAWHTHQLTPKTYYAYTVAETKRFVNHDDKIPERSLHVNFQQTSAIYEKKYGQPYSECACWYCECTREPMRSSFSNRINPFRSSFDVKDMAEKGLPKDPVNGPHVSAHNAFLMSGTTSAAERRRELQNLDIRYIKVQKRYKKAKREAPSKDNDAYIYSAYGYPMYYPVYVPYYAGGGGGDDECTTDGGGGFGGCVPGTCSEGASMGNCAVGSGVPSCTASVGECGGSGDADGRDGGSGGGDGGGGGGCSGGGDGDGGGGCSGGGCSGGGGGCSGGGGGGCGGCGGG